MQFLHSAFERHDANKLFDGIISATFGETYDAIKSQSGFKSGQLALVLVSEGLDGILAYLSCVLHGVVPIVLPENLGAKIICDFINLYEPEILIAKEKDCFSEIDGYTFSTNFILGRQLIVGNLCSSIHQPIEEISLLLPTSGSTGDPKLVKLSEKNISSNSLSICKSLGLTANDSVPITLPISYSFGISVINTHIHAGSKFICSDASILERSFWEAFSQCDARCIYGVPYHFVTMKKLKIFSKFSSNFRFLAQAGGNLNEDVKKWFMIEGEKYSKQFYVMYGQTECSPRISCFDLISQPSKIKSAGIPIDCCSVELREVIGGTENEICILGDSTFEGYANDRSEMYQRSARTGIHRTGDLGFIDADGYLYITGRVNRYAKLNGYRINLDRVEILLSDNVEDVAVLSDDTILKIYYVGTSNLRGIMTEFLVRNLKIPASSLKFYNVLNILRTSNGKINYKALERSSMP